MDTLAPVFTLKLQHKIHPRMVTVGKYDGIHPCLTCATTASKVFVHNPYNQSLTAGRMAVTDSDISLLTLNQSVTALHAGKLDPSHNRDVLCIGTQTNILAYDVHNNTDLFYSEVMDGVNSLKIGSVKDVDCPLVIAGGNCTLQGFDAKGMDKFWTVTGDMVSSLVLTDFTQDGNNELVVGSEDFDIRIFSGDAILSEINETEAVTHLCKIKDSKFAYGLANGTIGVYDGTARTWRIKSKQQVMSIYSYDIDGDGVDELITGWSNGKVDARSTETGDVIFKDTMNHAIAGLVDADYRMEGSNQLIACSVEGEVRGYQNSKSRSLARVDAVATSASRVDKNEMKDLSLLKQNLLMELENYKREIELLNKSQKFSISERVENAIIPANTCVSAKLHISPDHNDQPHVQLVVYTNNDTIIRMAVLFAEGLFEGESHVVHPPLNTVSNQIAVGIYPNKDVEVDLHIQALIGLPGSNNFHVFELTKKLPTFSSYLYVKSLPDSLPESYVLFNLSERIQRIALWISDHFLLPHQVEYTDSQLKVQFVAIRGGFLSIEMNDKGQMKIIVDDIDVAGSIIQSLAAGISISDLQVQAHFPRATAAITETMGMISDLQSTSKKQAAQMYDSANLIKGLIVQTEDSRILEDMVGMRRGYTDIQEMNRNLVNHYKMRTQSHQQLVDALKQVNQIIQKAARLRVGKYKTEVVSQCREAIKNYQVSTLCKIFQAGSA